MIRVMRGEDAPAVSAIIRESLGYPCDTAVVRERIAELSNDSHYVSLVSVDDSTGCVRGFIHAARYETLHRRGGWDVISLAVAADAQGRGHGKRLLRAFEEHARECGGTYVRLNSRVERTDAHRFYEHMGYTCDKVQKRFIAQIAAPAT